MKTSYSLLALLLSTSLLTACGSPKIVDKAGNPQFSQDDAAPTVAVVDSNFGDKQSSAPVTFTKTINLNSEFKVSYKTSNPPGVGEAEFKAKTMKVVKQVGEVTAEPGKQLVLVEIAIKGKASNKGLPSTFNQIGDYPSPQFVMVDRPKNKSFVETTYYSDSYTVSNKLFELSKITLDAEQWVNTAIVFEIDASLAPNLAFRFINQEGKVEFYDIK